MNNKKGKAYPYHDEQGQLLYVKRRKPGKTKAFYWERTDQTTGKTVYDIGNCRRVLYLLPIILQKISENQTIYLVEGEKDANTLFGHGLTTTTAPTPQWLDEYTATLTGADVIIVYDYDKAGFKRKDLLCKQLYGKVKRLRVVDLPGIEYRESHGLDITDWLEMGHTIEELKTLVEQTPDYQPEAEETPASGSILHPVSVEELFNLELPEREMLMDPFLPSQGLIMLVAKRGVGKTHIALGIGYAIAVGGTFLLWTAPTPKRVLYVDGEMPAVLMKERLSMLATMFPTQPSKDFLQLLTPDLQDRPMPDLSRPEGRQLLETYINDFDLIVLDNISCLFRTGYENESDSWQEAQEWALDLRRRGKSVLFVHHAGKSGIQRGTSKREDILDAVIILKHSDDYKAEDGARFEVHFDKARHFTGNDARSFQAHLQTDGTTWRWEISDAPHEQEINEIAQMKNDGYTIKEIVNETTLTKAQVEYRLAKAKEKGLIMKKNKIS